MEEMETEIIIANLDSYDFSAAEKREICDVTKEIIKETDIHTKQCKYVKMDVVNTYVDDKTGHNVSEIKIVVEIKGEIPCMGHEVFAGRLKTWILESNDKHENVHDLCLFYNLWRK
jgi:hypothetical protein